jgi:hypothetical protein
VEPILLLLLAAWLAKTVTQYRVDREYAKQGLTSPRIEAKLAAYRAGQRATEPARPGAKGYFRELWHDAWEDMTDRHRRIREGKKAGEHPTLRERAAGWWRWAKEPLGERPVVEPVTSYPEPLPASDPAQAAGQVPAEDLPAGTWTVNDRGERVPLADPQPVLPPQQAPRTVPAGERPADRVRPAAEERPGNEPVAAWTLTQAELLRTVLYGKCAYRAAPDRYCDNPADPDMPYCGQHGTGNVKQTAETNAETSTGGNDTEDNGREPARIDFNDPQVIREIRNGLYGLCAHRTRMPDGFADQWCKNPNRPGSAFCWEHGSTTQNSTTPKGGNDSMGELATVEEVTTNEALRTNLNHIAQGAAELADALAAAEAARAKILASAEASGDGVDAKKFDVAATAAVHDIRDGISTSTLTEWSGFADSVHASAKAGLDALDQYRDSEAQVAETGIDATVLSPTAA